MAKDKDKQQPAADGGGTASALVKPPSSEEAAALAALAEAGFGAESADGLSEVSANDLRMPLKLYNLKQGEAVNGKVTQDVFFDTIDKTVMSELNLVLLELHKANAYKLYNNKDKRTETVCTSYDRIQGVMAESGVVRPCKGCPDTVWRKNAEGRKVQPCSEVWNVAAFDLDTQRVVLVKFKRTSLDAIRTHLQAHHINRRPLPGGKRGHIPLFAYRVKMTIAMDKSGNFAMPSIERGAMLSVADLRVMLETAEGVRANFQARLNATEADDTGGGGDGGEGGVPDTSFDTAAMDAANARGTEAFVDP